MATRMQVTYLAAGFIIFGTQLPAAIAQPRNSSVFSHLIAYSKSLEALNEEHATQLKTKTQLLKERDEIQKNLSDTQKDLQAVNAREIVNQLRLIENQIAMGSIMDNVNILRNSGTQQPARMPSRYLIDQQMALTAMENIQFDNAINLQDRGIQLNAAARAVVERRQKLLMSARDVALRAQTWKRADSELVDQYLELSDVANTHSRLELAASLRVLERADSENMGAQLAKAITLLRLGQNDDAGRLLEKLSGQLTEVQPLVLAVRGELLARAGETTRAKKALNEALRFAPDRAIVRLFRAQSLSIMKEPEAAVTEWQKLLNSGQHDIAAHRGLALTCCSVSPAGVRYQKLAMEHAKLAQSLSGDDDWSCQIALSLATAIAGDVPAAAALADAAAEKAIAERRQQCLEIAAQLKAGHIPAWKF